MMLTRLAERLSRLERTTAQTHEVFIVRGVAPGQLDREIQTLWQGEQRWVRKGGESEDEFVERAKPEVSLTPSGVTYLIGE